MPQLTLTAKTASYGVLAGLPAVNISTPCAAANPAYYDAAVGTLSPAVAAGMYLIAKVTCQNAVGATVRTLRVVKQDGTVLLQFAPASQPAQAAEATATLYSARITVGDPADWVNVKLQVSSNTAGDVVVTKAATLVLAFAESCNVTDEGLVKRNINNLYFITMQPTQEAVLGRVGSATATAFLILPVNGLTTGFRWDTNSGNTLYSWDGSSVGLAV